MAPTPIDERIFGATLEILRTRGPLAVSIESVATTSGVAKTTIYRRFDNRDSLLTAVVRSSATAVEIPDGLSAQEAVRWVLRHARDTIENVVGRGTVAAVIADTDPHFTGLLRGMIRTSTNAFRRDLIERAIAGEIEPDLDIELTISLLLGVVLAALVRGQSTDDAWVESVVTLLWPILDPRHPRAPEASAPE